MTNLKGSRNRRKDLVKMLPGMLLWWPEWDYQVVKTQEGHQEQSSPDNIEHHTSYLTIQTSRCWERIVTNDQSLATKWAVFTLGYPLPESLQHGS